MDTDDRDKLKRRIADLYQHLERKLDLKSRPKIILVEDVENAKDFFGLTGYFNPDSNIIKLYITDRHPKDVARSFVHECIHSWQHQNGKFDNVENETEEGYAQKNPHLRKMEQQAFLIGNMLFRDYCDNMKRKQGL